MPHDLGEDLPGVTPDAALHSHVAAETDATQGFEGPREVRVACPGLEAVAVGEMDVGDAALGVFFRGVNDLRQFLS